MRDIPELVLPWAALAVAVTAAVGQQRASCALRPFLGPRIDLPARGVIRADTTDNDPCDPAGPWERMASDSLEVRVAPDGPAGSGRYWNVTIGVARPQDDSLLRGTCLVTATLGWRTLQNDGEVSLPMPWLDDRDRDGRPEVIVWGDFPLRREATPAEYGLVAWVYEFDGRRFVFDTPLTRAVAREIAAAYRIPNTGNDSFKTKRRMAAARALELMASGRCAIRGAR